MTKGDIISMLMSKLDDDTSYEWYECVRMIIKVLNKELCDDCIRRQDALDCLKSVGLKKFDFILDARNKIKNLPSVQQEPVLDKIRVEITNIEISGQIDSHTSFVRTGKQVKNIALEIIDKYRQEE